MQFVMPFVMQRILAVGTTALVLVSGCTSSVDSSAGGTRRNSDQVANDEPATAQVQKARGHADQAVAPGASASGAATGPPAADAPAAVDDVIRKPATVAEAARAIDLRTFPQLPGSEKPRAQTVASLSYLSPADVKTAYEFQRRNLSQRQWKELPDAQVSDQFASGQFSRDGFLLSASVFPGGDAGKVLIQLQNLSNVNLRKLPVPPGCQLQYAFPAMVAFETTAGVDETAAAVRKLLVDEGWQPYGTAGDSMHFRHSAVLLNARVLAPPAQPGKTVIHYSARQISAELPAPADVQSVQYAEPNKRLDFDAPGTPDDMAAYYKSALAGAGWQATTENPVKEQFTQFMIFRNPAKDMLTLNLRDLPEKKMTRVSLTYETAAEVDEIERQIKAQVEARQKKEEEERNQPKPAVALPLPAGASDVQTTPSKIEFKLATGQGKAAVDEIAKSLQAVGWKIETQAGNEMAGQITFKKDDLSIDILYVDPGFIPAEIAVSTSGAELRRASP